jgi:type II secretory pathway pseudopilin PulG
MMQRAFSLAEVVVVSALAAVLCALMLPVFSKARDRANVRSSLERLRQLHVAISIYRQDWETGGWTITALGLPSYAYVYGTYMGFGKDFFRSPCGYKDGIEGNEKRLSYQYWAVGLPGVDKYFEQYRDNSVLFNDPHCNPSAIVWTSPYTTKQGLAVQLDGKLILNNKPGSPGDPAWWTSPPDR